MAKKKETYSQAMARLETIVRQVDSNELDIDELVEKMKVYKEHILSLSEYNSEYVDVGDGFIVTRKK